MDSPVVIILASGRGRRFRQSGAATDKLQTKLLHQTVLQHTLDAVRASGLPWHLEDRGLPGMADSISAAVDTTALAPGWLILPADLPLIRGETLLAVASAMRQHMVVIPHYRGQRGHPVGFTAPCLARLLALRGDGGAAAVAALYSPFQLAVNDPGCAMDIDTVEDLQQAERLMMLSARLAPAPVKGLGEQASHYYLDSALRKTDKP